MVTNISNFWRRLAAAFSLRVVTLVVAILVACPARAALIDFESTPGGGLPSDDLSLPQITPYVFGGLQVYFGIDANSDGTVETNSVFEHAGADPFEPPNGGFSSYDSGVFYNDTADPGYTGQLGSFFLRGPTGGADFGLFVITYAGAPLPTAASGEVWDIDGTAQIAGGPGFTEEYTVRAYDSLNNLLATQISPLGTLASDLAPLDGKPWTFSFSGLSTGISKITIDFTGTKPMGIGLAFNNFNPTGAAVPEPSGLLIAAIASAAFIARRRSWRWAS